MTAEEQASLAAVAIYLLLFSSFFSFSFEYIVMVFTRNQTENMSKDELVEELLKLSYVSSKLSEPTEKFNDFVSKYDKVYSELQISRNCNNHLLQRIILLERNVVTNSQYHRRETIEITLFQKVWGMKFWRRMSAKICP